MGGLRQDTATLFGSGLALLVLIETLLTLTSFSAICSKQVCMLLPWALEGWQGSTIRSHLPHYTKQSSEALKTQEAYTIARATANKNLWFRTPTRQTAINTLNEKLYFYIVEGV